MSNAEPKSFRIDVDPKAVDAEVSDTTLRIVLSSGLELRAPLSWFPRLRHATAEQRNNWQVSAGGYGLHWRELDEDISVRALMGRLM